MNLEGLLWGQRFIRGIKEWESDCKTFRVLFQTSEVLNDSQFLFFRKHPAFDIKKRDSNWPITESFSLKSLPSSERAVEQTPKEGKGLSVKTLVHILSNAEKGFPGRPQTFPRDRAFLLCLFFTETRLVNYSIFSKHHSVYTF